MSSRSIHFTMHALQRFAQRVQPGVTLDVAHRVLTARWPHATRLRRHTHGGQEQWRITEPDALLVVIHEVDPRTRARGLVCKTVLGPNEIGFPLDELEPESVPDAPAVDPSEGTATFTIAISYRLISGFHNGARIALEQFIGGLRRRRQVGNAQLKDITILEKSGVPHGQD